MAKKGKKKKKEKTVDEATIIEGEFAEEKLLAEEETPEPPSVEQLMRELEEARAEAAEYLDGWQRTRAEFANFRKRQNSEREQQIQLSNALLISKILPVLDDLERAMATLPDDLDNPPWLEGITMIKRKLAMVLESEGMKPINTEGQLFDPRYHEGVSREVVEGYEDGQIIGEVQRGYLLGDRIVRPAMVRVAQAPDPPTPEPEENTEGE
jgi:molecular chaperone GrpE